MREYGDLLGSEFGISRRRKIKITKDLGEGRAAVDVIETKIEEGGSMVEKKVETKVVVLKETGVQ